MKTYRRMHIQPWKTVSYKQFKGGWIERRDDGTHCHRRYTKLRESPRPGYLVVRNPALVLLEEHMMRGQEQYAQESHGATS